MSFFLCKAEMSEVTKVHEFRLLQNRTLPNAWRWSRNGDSFLKTVSDPIHSVFVSGHMVILTLTLEF